MELQLSIEGREVVFEPLEEFRQRWGLPEAFGVAHFEPKDWAGMGSLSRAGEPLAALTQNLLRAVPARLAATDLADQIEALSGLFRRELQAANEHIGLREPEIEFSVAGFEAILLAAADRLARLRHARRPGTGAPSGLCGELDYAGLYQTWLDSSVRRSIVTHDYAGGPQPAVVRVVYYAYGRAGMEVDIAGERHYVADTRLACPAASFMRGLCAEVAERLCQAVELSA